MTTVYHVYNSGIHEITVDYSNLVEELVKTGNYDYPHPDITSSNFTTARTGERRLEAILVRLVCASISTVNPFWIDTELVLAKLEARDMRAGELHELLALGTQHFNKYLDFPIAALGSSVTRGGYCRFPLLDYHAHPRQLVLGPLSCGWPEYCRFLAFPK